MIRAVTFFRQPCRQNDGFCDLYRATRHVACRHFLTVVVVGAEFAGEYLNATLAAEQDHFLLEDGYTVNGAATGAVTTIHLKGDAEIECQVAGIISAVERERFHVNVRGENARLFSADTDGVIDYHLIALGKEHAQVFQAIFIIAVIKI